jgi:serine/threonine-protein phosphatase 2A regulatory subunit B'
LQQCCIIFDFDDADLDVRGREIKRETLGEMAEYVNTPIGQKIFTEAMMPDIVEMVKVNLFRTLPPQADDFDPEEDEPAMEPAWPHLQVVYEFFLRFIVSTEVNGKVAKKYVDQSFIRMWVELFDAEDPRERDYVKTVLHRIYGKFMSYRSYIRKAISQVFFRYIYETGRYASSTLIMT